MNCESQVSAGDVHKIGSRDYTVKGVTRSGKVCLKSNNGVTKWATISELNG